MYFRASRVLELFLRGFEGKHSAWRNKLPFVMTSRCIEGLGLEDQGFVAKAKKASGNAHQSMSSTFMY